MPNKAKATKALLMVIELIREVVMATGSQGAPSGHVYAALMTHGCTLNQYNDIIGIMTRAGMVRLEGNVLYSAGADARG